VGGIAVRSPWSPLAAPLPALSRRELMRRAAAVGALGLGLATGGCNRTANGQTPVVAPPVTFMVVNDLLRATPGLLAQYQQAHQASGSGARTTPRVPSPLLTNRSTARTR